MASPRTRRLTGILALGLAVGWLLPTTADAQRRRRRARGPGSLVIQSTVEGAEVLVDEDSRGFTPIEPLSLAPGEHTVRVRRPGYTEFDDVVTIAPGRTLEVEVDLIALAMVVTVRSNPDEARVFVDGTFRGQTPIELELVDGEHTLRVAAPRYHADERTITARPGETELIDVTLEEVPEELLNPRAPEWYEEPLPWILIGSGVAALAVVTIVLVLVLTEGTPLQGFCGADETGCDLVVRPGWEF